MVKMTETNIAPGDQAVNQKTRIILADDHPLLRHALRNVLEKQPDIDIVAEAGDGEEAVKLVSELAPDLIIMDISMPTLNGLEATKLIKAEHPDTAVLILTVHDDNEFVLGLLKAGADGYLTKSVFGDQIVCAVRSLLAKEMVLSPSISLNVIESALNARKLPPHDNLNKLTSRELEVLKLVAKGLTNKDIAHTLGVTLRTVKGYLVDIFIKLDVQSRTEAVTVGLREGLFTLEDENIK
jgi:DNA-binding NarL/FixJ family response regulator